MVIKLSKEALDLLQEADALNDRFLGIKFVSLNATEEQKALMGTISEHSKVMTQLGYLFYQLYKGDSHESE